MGSADYRPHSLLADSWARGSAARTCVATKVTYRRSREISSEDRKLRGRVRREHSDLFNEPSPEVLPSVDAMATALEQAEAWHESTVEKYHCAKIVLIRSAFESDRAPMQAFIKLIGLHHRF